MESQDQPLSDATKQIATHGNSVVTAANGSIRAAKDFLTPEEGVRRGERSEGAITKQIESVTSKVPSGTFLSFAFGSMGVSALLHLVGRKEDAMFVGQWVPAILIMGLYNKLVKLEGSASKSDKSTESF